jgi:predicted esterase
MPSSAAFNVASGDQIHPLLARVPLSDSVTVGDFNHDGKPDVAQTNVIAGTVSVLLGDGRGGFSPPRLHPVGVSPVFVAAGDLDLDGRLDLAVANFGSNDVAVLRGNGDGSFQPASFIPAPAPRNVAIGKFNSDDIPDLAVASSAPGTGTLFTPNTPTAGGVAVLAGDGVGGFNLAQFLTTTAGDRPVNANYVASGDFDRDGRDDLAVGVGISSNAGDQQSGDTKLTGDDALIFLNRHQPLGTTPGEPFSSAPEQRIRVGAWPAAITVADLNGDADPDLAVLDSASGDITTLLGDSTGRFVVKATNATAGAIPRSLAAADFNDDGVLDMVTASFAASTISVLQGNGDGTFRPAVDFWSGDATTSAAVGDFNDDGRVDVVAGRLRNDHLALLLNDSPHAGDGVVIERDIYYGIPTDAASDPFAAHRTLDVYSPPPGTASFAGSGQPYPVVFFAHGGGFISGDKSMVGYFMRSLALEGVVAVSTNYRLGPGYAYPQTKTDAANDVAEAFRWTRDHIGSSAYGGDPRNIFVFGYSAGAEAAAKLATEDTNSAEQKNIRGLVLAGLGPPNKPGNAAVLPPSLLFNGDESLEPAITGISVAFTAESRRRGGESDHVIVTGRDHLTLVSDMALDGDPGRVALLNFMSRHIHP